VRVYLDSMVWIYAFEGNSPFGATAQTLFRNLRAAGHTVLVSHFLLAELLVVPVRNGNSFLVASCKHAMLAYATVELAAFTAETAVAFATLRARHRTPSADAIHLSLAANAQADVFVTADTRLQKLVVVPGIGAIVDLAYNLPARRP